MRRLLYVHLLYMGLLIMNLNIKRSLSNLW